MLDDDDYDPTPPRRTRVGVVVLVGLLHVAAILGLIRAFAPDFTAQAVDRVLSTFTVTITAPPPQPPAAAPETAGDAGAAGKKAVAAPTAAPSSRIAVSKTPAPRARSTGSAPTAGAAAGGDGTGAGTAGSGSGAGGSGSGAGGGLAARAAHIGGQLNNARDFPVPPGGRAARIGRTVILALTVAPSGRAVACRVYRSSGLPETDAVSCVLAQERLRFKPATNDAGEAVTSTFYWQQKFFF